MAAGVFGTRTGAQRGMFSAGDAYERFMGRWSRELAPLLVQFAGFATAMTYWTLDRGPGP